MKIENIDVLGYTSTTHLTDPWAMNTHPGCSAIRLHVDLGTDTEPSIEELEGGFAAFLTEKMGIELPDGLSDLWLEQADARIKIPMQGSIDSMNVSVAAGILIFEAKRQRNFKS